MKVQNIGFEITDISDKIEALKYDGQTLRIQESSLAHSIGLTAYDVDALIEALTEAKRLMTATPATPTSTLTPARQIRDRDGDVWTLLPAGEHYFESGGAHLALSKIKERYGPVTELPD
jgi:hypothetical protein